MENILEQIVKTHQEIDDIVMALSKITSTTYDKGARYITKNVVSDMTTITYRLARIEKRMDEMLKEAEDFPVLPGERTIDQDEEVTENDLPFN